MQTTPQSRIDEFTQAKWWGEQTIYDLFVQAEKRSDHLALVDPANRATFTDGFPQRLTYGQLSQHIDALSDLYFRGGIRENDIVVIQLPNIIELPITYLALARLGAIVSPVPVQYGAHELNQAIEKLDPAAYVTVSNLKSQNLSEAHGRLFEQQCPVFSFGDDVGAAIIPLNLQRHTPSPAWQTYVETRTASANDILTICWTSGTTGSPKGVPRSHNHWIISGISSSDSASMTSEDIILNPFPMVNMAGLGGFLFPWLLSGNTLVLHHPFDLNQFLQQIADESVSYTIAAPALLNMLLKDPDIMAATDLSSLRAIGSGGSPLTEWMVSTFQNDYNIPVSNIFGSNEGMCLSSSAVDLPNPADRAVFFPRYGLPGAQWKSRVSKMTKTRLVDASSGKEIVVAGIQGELEISGPSVFDGYWQSEQDNLQVFSEDGYFRTGDVFEIVDDPINSIYYRFVGRSKDIIVRGGMNISPDEIDSLLAGHPKLAAAAVTGYDDDLLGERVGAVVVVKPGESVVLLDITDYLRQLGIAVFKLPEQLRVVASLPINATGKVVRRDLKPLFEKPMP